MAGRSQENEHHKPSPRDVDIWQGLELELDTPSKGTESSAVSKRPTLPEQEPAELEGRVPWLSHWLLVSGVGALALSAAWIETALQNRTEGILWYGALLALYCSVVLLMLRAYLRPGADVGLVCRRVVGGFLLGGSVLVGQLAVARAVLALLQGAPPYAPLAFGGLGALGAVAAVQSLRGRTWACRLIAVSGVAGMIVVGACAARAGCFGLSVMPRLARHGMSLGLLAACSGVLAGLIVARRSRGRVLAIVVFTLPLIATLVFLVYGVVRARHPFGTVAVMGLLTGLWEAVALLPVLAVGLKRAWCDRGRWQDDMVGTVSFGWSAVVTAGAVSLAMLLFAHLRGASDVDGFLLIGVLSGMVVAWLGARSAAWAADWGVMPMLVGATVLLFMAPPFTGEALLTVAYAVLWCCAALGMICSVVGLLVMRRRLRSVRTPAVLWADVRMPALVGACVWGALFCIWFAGFTGDEVVRGGLEAWLVRGHGVVADVAARAGGSAWARMFGEAGQRMLVWPGSQACGWRFALAGALMGLHLLALSRVRWCVLPLVVLWVCVLAAAAALFGVAAGQALKMGVGMPMAMLGAVLSCVLWRLGEAVAAALRIWTSDASAAEATQPAALADRVQGNVHVAFLTRVGAYAAVLGLGFAFLLRAGVGTGAVPFQLVRLTDLWLSASLRYISDVGEQLRGGLLRVSAATLTAYVLVSIHDEARRRRVAAYPAVALAWMMVLWPQAQAWVLMLTTPAGDVSQGDSMRVALMITGPALLALALGACVLALRWLRAQHAEESIETEPDRFGVARTMGWLGLTVWPVVTGLALYAGVTGRPLAHDLAPALRRIAEEAAWQVELARHILGGWLLPGAIALGAACLALLILHALAQRRVRGMRMALLCVWSLSASVAVAALLLALQSVPIGEWSVWRVACVLLLMAGGLRVVVALACSRTWVVGKGTGA
jgi:hypothetical protein